MYDHPDQIWAVETSPLDPTLVITSHQDPHCSKALTLWRMDKQREDDMAHGGALYANEHLELQQVTSFNQSQQVYFVDSIKWHRSEAKLLTFDGRMLSHWAISDSNVSVRWMGFELVCAHLDH